MPTNMLFNSLAAFFGEDRPSRSSIARKLGITESYLSLLIDKKRTPSLPLALRMSKLTGVPIESLIGTSNAPEDRNVKLVAKSRAS